MFRKVRVAEVSIRNGDRRIYPNNPVLNLNFVFKNLFVNYRNSFGLFV